MKSKRPKGQERRAVTRYEHERASEAVVLDAGNEVTGAWWQVYLRDLSVRGAQILVAEPLEVGDRLLTALNPNDAEPIMRLAVVRRVIERRDRWSTVGVEFVPFTENTRTWATWTALAARRATEGAGHERRAAH